MRFCKLWRITVFANSVYSMYVKVKFWKFVLEKLNTMSSLRFTKFHFYTRTVASTTDILPYSSKSLPRFPTCFYSKDSLDKVRVKHFFKLNLITPTVISKFSRIFPPVSPFPPSIPFYKIYTYTKCVAFNYCFFSQPAKFILKSYFSSKFINLLFHYYSFIRSNLDIKTKFL